MGKGGGEATTKWGGAERDRVDDVHCAEEYLSNAFSNGVTCLFLHVMEVDRPTSPLACPCACE